VSQQYPPSPGQYNNWPPSQYPQQPQWQQPPSQNLPFQQPWMYPPQMQPGPYLYPPVPVWQQVQPAQPQYLPMYWYHHLTLAIALLVIVVALWGSFIGTIHQFFG